MKYFITGFTGSVVPIISEELMEKDPDAFLYIAIRKGSGGDAIQSRFESMVASLDSDESIKQKLIQNSKLVEIDIEKEKIGIDPDLYTELIENTDKILHGAADIRFDQPYEKIKIPNVVFTQDLYELFDKMKKYREKIGTFAPTFYYISTSFSFGIVKGLIPEESIGFQFGPPQNSYALTKREAKLFMLDKVKAHNDQIVIFEPPIIGGSSVDGKIRAYSMHYVFMMLGYMGKIPFLTAPDNKLDIIPVDWVAAVISDIMAKDEFHQGTIRLASGANAITNKMLRDIGVNYYKENDPVPGHEIQPVRFVPKWLFLFLFSIQKYYYKMMFAVTKEDKHRKMIKGIEILKDYIPYLAGNNEFEITKSTQLIEKYTDCSTSPLLQDTYDDNGKLIKGYFEKILKDTLNTGWGGMVDFERLKKKISADEQVN